MAKKSDTASSDIDLMVVSDELEYPETFAALESIGATLGRNVNPTILTRKELARRVKANESFVSRVLSQPKIWIIGDERALAA